MIDYTYVEDMLSRRSKSVTHLKRYVKFLKILERCEWDSEKITQKHHCVPKWLGGIDDGNLIVIPVEWHLYLHKLLVQVVRDYGSVAAVHAFTTNKINEKTFYKAKSSLAGMFKTQYSEMQASLTKNTIWLNKDGKDTRADREKAMILISEGWSIGRSNKAVVGMCMMYDNIDKKFVKIRKSEIDPDRHEYKPVVPCVDITKTENYPYFDVIAVYKDVFDSSENLVTANSYCKKLKDGRWIARDAVSPETEVRFVSGVDSPGGRFLGVYVTPFGIFKNVWDFEKLGIFGRGALISTCKKNCDRVVTKEWVDRSGGRVFRNEHIGKTPREMGWYFIEKDKIPPQMMKDLYPSAL